MALNKKKLEEDILDAFESCRALTDRADALRNLSQKLSLAIYNYYINAEVITTSEGIVNGGVNSSNIVLGAPIPGTLTVLANGIGTGKGILK